MTKKVVTNDGKKGGWLVGKRHYDKSGKPLGGVKAVVTDAGGKPVELEGGEVIINREASKKHWKELSRINQSAGNGVAIEPPSGAFDEDPSEDYENGGKIEFNANHIPNKWILNYAIKIKEEHPDVWALGGNIFGNQAFINLKRVAERGHWLDSEEWMYKKWRSFVARHKGDFRIQGVIAMLKWVDKVDKGWQYMKNLIEEEIKKREAKKSRKMSNGGSTPAPLKDRIKGSKFNEKGTASTSSKAESIKFDDKTIASIQSLIDAHNEKYPSKKITLAVAKAVVRRGMGAYSSSHKTTITGGKPNSRTAWGLARLKAFIYKAQTGKSKSRKYSQDNDLFEELNISVQKMNNGGDVRGMSWYSDFKKQQLKKGTEHELEHADTIEKFKKEGVSDRQVAAQIAQDHLEEDENYYIELDKMERKKFATGGLVTTYSGEANVGDKGQLNTRKGRIDIEITNITDKWVIFNDLTEGGKRKDTPRDKFIENYRGNAPLGSSVQSQQVVSTTNGLTSDDFKNTKIIVDTPEKSKKFQELLFSLGGEWTDLDVPKKSLRKKVHFTDEEYLLVGSDLVFFYFSKKDPWDDSSKKEIFYDDIFRTQTTKSKTSTWKPSFVDYRIKTESEFKSEFGTDWRSIVGWTSSSAMDWLFGKRLSEITVKGKEKDNYESVLSNSVINTDPNKDPNNIFAWSLNAKTWIYDPVSSQQTESKPEYVLKKPLKREDLYDIKITVDTPEKSKAFQKAAFSLGFSWYKGKQDIINTDAIYLFLDKQFSTEYEFGFGNEKNKDFYQNNTNKELFFDDLFELKTAKTESVSDTQPKDKEVVSTTPKVSEEDVKSEKDLLVEQYNDVLFLISVTPTTDTENMLSLKPKARELKDAIDLIDLELRKKAQTELTLLDELFDASTIKPQERYKFMPYTDGFAPDGQPTALPKNVYNWTMSEEFQNWFGNFTLAYNYRNSSYENVPCSVVVNKNYEPLIVYHGTGSEFSFFKFDSFPAMYFAENEAYSNWFAEMKGQQNGTQGYVYPFVLNIRTPLDLTLFEANKISATEFIDWMYLQTGLDENELKVNKALLDPSVKNQAWVYLRNSPEMLKVLRDKNVCDGIIYYEDNPSVDVSSPAYMTKAYIVFNANSAKIANNERHIQTIPAMRSFFLKRGGKL
jgi:hypothetical protein